MLLLISQVLSFAVITFILSALMYPAYIRFLQKIKAWKSIREDTATGEKAEIFNKLHSYKAWTPTMWGWLFLLITAVMIGVSVVFQNLDYITYSLRNQQETYILLFGFFSMWLIGLIDDILNIKQIWKIKWLNIRAKMIGLCLFSAFISYWFYIKLGIDYVNLRPIAGKIQLWIFFPIATFIITIAIVNAINITDWLDWLAGWLSMAVLWTFLIATFLNWTYIASTVLWVIVSILGAFLFFNVKPAKVFMWDSGAFAIWWIIATTLYLLNMRTGILIPFFIVFLLFNIELCSSGLQMLRKKIFHKKLFPIAPFHHLLEYRDNAEYTIVMKARLIQIVLMLIWVLCLLVQYALR